MPLYDSRFRAHNYSEFWLHTEIENFFLYVTYMFNIVEECEGIYIEIRYYLDRKLQMTD